MTSNCHIIAINTYVIAVENEVEVRVLKPPARFVYIFGAHVAFVDIVSSGRSEGGGASENPREKSRKTTKIHHSKFQAKVSKSPNNHTF